MATRVEFSNNTSVFLDLTSNVKRKTKTKVTENPISNGYNLTQLATTTNTRYFLRGIMSDAATPNQILGIGTGAVTQFTQDDRARYTDDLMIQAQKDVAFVTVELGAGFSVFENPNQRVLTDLIIEDWDIDISPDNIKGYSWTLTLVQPRIRVITNSVSSIIFAGGEVEKVTAPAEVNTNTTATKDAENSRQLWLSTPTVGGS